MKTGQEALNEAAQNGDIQGIKKAIAEGADPKNDQSLALRFCASRGHTGCIEFLIPLSDPKENDSEALQWVAMNGFHDCARLLIPVSDADVAREQLKENGSNKAVALLDSVIQENALKDKHLKTAGHARATP